MALLRKIFFMVRYSNVIVTGTGEGYSDDVMVEHEGSGSNPSSVSWQECPPTLLVPQ